MPEARRTRVMLTLLISAAAIQYLIGNASVPLWDRDEPRYAQTSRQMLVSGDWVVPRLLEQVRTAKPILIYWLQASAMKLFGANAFAARFPSVVAMVLTLIVLAVVIGRTIGPRRALWAVFILGSSALTIAAAKMCLTDAILLLWITIAQICLLRIYARGSGFTDGKPEPRTLNPEPLIMWLAIALAGLTKGPVVVGVLLMTMLVLAALDVGRAYRSTRTWFAVIRWWRFTRPLLGIAIVALVCGPWLYLIHRREPSFLPQIIAHDVWTRMRTPLEGHRGPPGFYLLTIWATYFPWCLLLPATIVWGWQRRINPVMRFSFAAIVGPWVMFEIVQTKLVHYILPVFPFLALVTADMLIRGARRKSCDLTARGFLLGVRIWSAVVLMLGLLPWITVVEFQLPAIAFIVMTLLSVLAFEYARSVLRLFDGRRILDAAAIMGAGMMIIVAVIYGVYFPNAPFLQTSQRVAHVLIGEGAVDPGDVIMIDYKEDSLAFYQGGTIRRQNDAYLLTHDRWEWPRWVVITDRIWKTMPPPIRDQFEVITSVRGWWYVKGFRVVDVLVIRRKSPFASGAAWSGQ